MFSAKDHPAPSAPSVFTATFVEHTKGEVTVILNASQEAHILDESFQTNAKVVLIYSEKIELKHVASLRGKQLKIGLFCNEFTIHETAVIDVSGTSGQDGSSSTTSNGEAGKMGSEAGEVWLFVQSATREMVKNLAIKAYGGDGGRGGDSSATGKKSKDKHGNSGGDEEEAGDYYVGGDGGDGAKGGNIEVVFGTSTQQMVKRIRELARKPWPRQALTLRHGGDLPDAVWDRISRPKDKKVIEQLLEYQRALLGVATSLDHISTDSKAARDVKGAIDHYLRSEDPPKAAELVKSIQALDEVAKKFKSMKPEADNEEEIRQTQVSTHLVETSERAELASIVVNVSVELTLEMRDLHDDIRKGCHVRGGGGGQGGRSPNVLLKPGSRGCQGADGGLRITCLDVDGSEADLESSQVYAFPDQCQMLLQQADLAFFNKDPAKLEEAGVLYRRLITRLGFLKHADFDRKDSSPLVKAYHQLTAEWKMTMSPKTSLQAVREQSERRLNRLYIGQDMWGHMETWVPRMSVHWYDDELERSLDLLEKEEVLSREFEASIRKGDELRRYVTRGIEALQKNQQAAQEQIARLTADNGPLNTAVYKITAFTPQLKEAKLKIKTRLNELKDTFKDPPFDYSSMLDALTTLVDCSVNPKSVLELAKQGADIYKSSQLYIDERYKITAKEYLVSEIKIFDGDIDDFEDSFATREDHTIDVADPTSVKFLATADKINQLFKQYRYSFADSARESLSTSLHDYQRLVQTRNDAILEFNSSIQLLYETFALEKSLKDQAADLGQKGTAADANLPSVAHWLRGAQRNLCLGIMQDLNSQSRAIRYWGLLSKPPVTQAMPLQNATVLAGTQNELHKAFGTCLERYARNVRNIWPADENQQGIFYKLKSTAFDELKKGQLVNGHVVFSTHIRLDPQTDHDMFRNNVDIRLSQVRLWLLGADCDKDTTGRKRLTIVLVHMGDEIIQNDAGAHVPFSHDRTHIQFDYFVDRVFRVEDALSKHVFGRQKLQDSHYLDSDVGASDIAAVGPFTTWKVVVSSADNPGLHMCGLKEAFLEFRGTSRLLIENERSHF